MKTLAEAKLQGEHGGGGGSSIVKVLGDMPPARYPRYQILKKSKRRKKNFLLLFFFFEALGTQGTRKGIFFKLSCLAKGIPFANFGPFSLGKGMLFGNFSRFWSGQGYAFWQF